MAVAAATVLAGCLHTAPASGPILPAGLPWPDLAAGGASAVHASGRLATAVELAGLARPVGAERGIGASAFEPTLGSDGTGALFMDARVNGAPGEHVRASGDHGMTWREAGPVLANGLLQDPPESDDPFLYVDGVTGRVFEVMLQGAQCAWVNFSDDQGATWASHPVDCGQPPGLHDHPSIVAAASRGAASSYQGRIVHYCVNEVAVSSCAASADGGATFGALKPVFAGAAVEPGAGFCGGTTGHVKADHAGRVVLGQVHCGVPTAYLSEDDGATWRASPIASRLGGLGHDVEFAADDADDFMAFWIAADGLPALSVSQDHGGSWSAPLRVGAPGVAAADYAVVAAGARGRIALGYLGTMTGNATHAVHAFLAVLPDVLAADPIVLTTQADRPGDPLAHGCCSGFGDFLDLTVDPDGRPWMALLDSCNEGCGGTDDAANKQAAVGTLVQGPSLWGGALPPLAWAPDPARPTV
jgi:hypothetical protein